VSERVHGTAQISEHGDFGHGDHRITSLICLCLGALSGIADSLPSLFNAAFKSGSPSFVHIAAGFTTGSAYSRVQTTLDLYTQEDSDEARGAQGEFLKAVGMHSGSAINAVVG
jgi:hypothetical protein